MKLVFSLLSVFSLYSLIKHTLGYNAKYCKLASLGFVTTFIIGLHDEHSSNTLLGTMLSVLFEIFITASAERIALLALLLSTVP